MSCTCTNSKQNVGTVNCQELMKYTNHRFLIPLYDDAGVANKIASGANVTDVYIKERLNDTDPSQRWYLLKGIKNPVSERSDDVVESFEDGSSVFIEEGVLNASFIVPSSSPTFVGKLKSFRCEKMGFMDVDKDGKLWGYVAGTSGDLYPITIMDNTLSVKPAMPTPTSSYNALVSFQWSKDVVDEGLGWWSNTVSWSSTAIRSLLDVNVVVTNESVTGYTLTLTYDYGAVNAKQAVKGLVITDFVSSVGGATSKVRRTNNTPADVTITSVTESADGVYDFVIPTATTGDILQPAATKNAFDFSNLLDVTVIVP